MRPRSGTSLSRQTFDGDARKYFRIGATGLLALRARGFKSCGSNPDYTYFGGNCELRGYDYLSFIGQNAFFVNAELRFPLIDAMATPIGVLGGIRARSSPASAAPVDGVHDFKVRPDNSASSPTASSRPIVDYNQNLNPVYGEPVVVDGLRLQMRAAATASACTTFALGFPAHFDWSWRTLFNRDWEDIVYS